MYNFEFDDIKSKLNFDKHGINFEDAQLLWNDPNLVEIPANTEDEIRHIVIAKINGKHWSGIITYRRERIRIISVRRSRKTEVNFYESY
ncbi:BrnT family toxin [Thalassotalea fonticola]|uniref:BrnT family toxin n=1 Tax=Thalassotalea fonticola TaxID=3065649 RepID=A0ABZ0GSJ7_9GAMM|nr:BrnT family toxin [Colwelliaceae bacterium S1-1]